MNLALASSTGGALIFPFVYQMRSLTFTFTHTAFSLTHHVHVSKKNERLQDVRQEAPDEWTIQCPCEDSGQRALEENTVSDVKATRQRTGQKIHDNEVTGQTAWRAVDVHTNCVHSITTSKSADPVVNCGNADEVRGSDPVISSDMTVELQPLSTQVGYMLLSDQAQERVRNSLECNGAVSSQLHYALVTMFVGAGSGDNEELSREDGCRRMAQAGLKHDPDVGVQYDATMQFLLKRRSGGYDETDSALEIES